MPRHCCLDLSANQLCFAICVLGAVLETSTFGNRHRILNSQNKNRWFCVSCNSEPAHLLLQRCKRRAGRILHSSTASFQRRFKGLHRRLSGVCLKKTFNAVAQKLLSTTERIRRLSLNSFFASRFVRCLLFLRFFNATCELVLFDDEANTRCLSRLVKNCLGSLRPNYSVMNVTKNNANCLR